MEKTVIIIFIIALLIGWISYLFYNYYLACINIKQANQVKYWKSRYENVQGCIEDLLDAIHEKFPKSTVKYLHNNEGIDRIEGEIKYDIR